MTPPAIGRVGGVLHVEGVSAEALAAAAGTPTYVYSAGVIRAQAERLQQVLSPVPHRIHYACKANGHVALLALLRSLGVCVDVVSGGELYRARTAGYQPGEIIFGGVGKSEAELDAALDAGVGLLSVESLDELELVNRLAAARGVVARVGVRVNPEVSVESFHEYIKTGEKGDKFGVPYDQAEAVALRAHALPHVTLTALGMHIGSQLSQVAPYGHGLERLEALVTRLRLAGVDTLEHLDIGGGLYVPYQDEAGADLEAYAATVLPVARRLGLTLIVEPGRFLVAESGLLLARVLYRKRTGGREILVTDAGMTELLRPSHYDAYHRIAAVRETSARGRFDVVGPICESGDFLALDREMEDLHPGELLAVLTAGAYGMAMASNYNARQRPAEVLVDGNRWGLITRRETNAELVQRESTQPEWRVVA